MSDFRQSEYSHDAETSRSDYLRALLLDVIDTLVDVFAIKRDAATAIVSEYVMDAMSKLDPEAWLLFLHLEPIQIAADLAGVSDRPLSEIELARYANFKRRLTVEKEPISMRLL